MEITRQEAFEILTDYLNEPYVNPDTQKELKYVDYGTYFDFGGEYLVTSDRDEWEAIKHEDVCEYLNDAVEALKLDDDTWKDLMIEVLSRYALPRDIDTKGFEKYIKVHDPDLFNNVEYKTELYDAYINKYGETAYWSMILDNELLDTNDATVSICCCADIYNSETVEYKGNEIIVADLNQLIPF
jgi:hypothetical protein